LYLINPKTYFIMNVSLLRSYRSKNGNATFVYVVKGNSTDVEAFKTAQGDYYREDDKGQPLWFTTRCIGNTGKLIITTNGNVVPDMSAFDQAASLAEQYGGNFGEQLAKSAAQAILGHTGASDVPAEAPKKAEPKSEDLGDI
jgi:hypothetical protein